MASTGTEDKNHSPLDDQTKALDILHTVVEELEKKLEPILKIGVEISDSNPLDIDSNTSSLMKQVSVNTTNIRVASNRISSLLDRLDI